MAANSKVIFVDQNKDIRAGESYAQWVSRAIRRARSSDGDVITLFDSSVPEPKALVRQVVTEGFGGDITPHYVTTFGGGNRYVIETLAERYGVDAGQILCTTGATGALALLCRTLLAPGDHALVETPGFDLFAELVEDAGARVGFFQRPLPDFDLDLADIERRLQPDTRLIILSNLHNPSGMPASHAALQALARIAEERGIHVVVDEVYGDYADEAIRPEPACALSPRFVSVSSLTKIWGLSTLRCGWIVAAPDLAARLRARHERHEFGLSNLSHAIASLVLRERQRFDEYTRDTIAASRPLMRRFLDEWRAEELVDGILPDFGCIFFPRITGLADTADFSDWLAARAGVIVAPGRFFGMPGHIRIGYAQHRETLDRGLAALGDGLREYLSLSRRARLVPGHCTGRT